MFTLSTYSSGLGAGAGLIMAIGAQNAHVLRTGLKREHVLLTVAACIVIDVILIGLGVGGLGAMVQASALLLGVARWGGAAFLLWYGLRSWRAVLGANALTLTAAPSGIGAGRALASVVGLSLLNPHLYLDTVVLLGAIGAQFPSAERGSFALGAMSASLLWFSALGFGARRFAHLFALPLAWRCIDAVTGSMMLVLAARIALAA
jgi:L-lysine exporter family protein LysE/ArgO